VDPTYLTRHGGLFSNQIKRKSIIRGTGNGLELESSSHHLLGYRVAFSHLDDILYQIVCQDDTPVYDLRFYQQPFCIVLSDI
jgi:hypothetical protein